MSELHADVLTDFGLTSLQSRVYVCLLSLGTCRASQLGAAVGIVRPEAYRILRELSSKGLVQRNLDSPTTYTATPPGRAISILLHRLKQRWVSLEAKKAPLIKSLSSAMSLADAQNVENVGLVTGVSNIILKVMQMLNDAKRDYVGITSKHALRIMHDAGIMNALVSARKRRVRVRLISEVEDSNRKSANYVARYVELRYSRELLFYMDIVDGKEMVLGPALSDEEAINQEERKRKVDLWTTDPRFIRGMYTMFEKLWETSPKYSPSHHNRH